MAKENSISKEDAGAVMMAWYADAIARHPEGLVTQAQAAHMLGISRVAVSRLVSRGYLRAEYFPKPPDVEGLLVGKDDPAWLKLIAWLDPLVPGSGKDPILLPDACYVSFADVKKLWRDSDLQDKCKVPWLKVLFTSEKELTRSWEAYQKRAKLERERDKKS